MWITLAFASAVAAALATIFAKCGIKKTDASVVTSLRTFVVLIFAWIIVFATGVNTEIPDISSRSLIFLILSGLTTGASWLFYYTALKSGNVAPVAAVDKFSTVITVVAAMFIFNEVSSLWLRITGVVLMTAGTALMAIRKGNRGSKSGSWFIYALLSAVFAAATTVLAKYGVDSVNSDVAVAIRTSVVLVMALIMVFVKGVQKGLGKVPINEIMFIILSGLATGASWLCYFKALKLGEASVVVSIDKLSIALTVAFAAVFLKEKVSWKSICGLLLIVAGTLFMVLLVK